MTCGLSNKTRIRYGCPSAGAAAKQIIIPVNKSAAQQAAADKAYNDTIAGKFCFIFLSSSLDALQA
jgi:hypothetical protein